MGFAEARERRRSPGHCGSRPGRASFDWMNGPDGAMLKFAAQLILGSWSKDPQLSGSFGGARRLLGLAARTIDEKKPFMKRLASVHGPEVYKPRRLAYLLYQRAWIGHAQYSRPGVAPKYQFSREHYTH